MNWKKVAYFNYAEMRGYHFPGCLADLARRSSNGSLQHNREEMLERMLAHCRTSVPFYAQRAASSLPLPTNQTSAAEALQEWPIVTKDIIRKHSEELKSVDLPFRKWSFNTSGGSTGEPLRLIQDADYRDRSTAITLFYYSLLGYEMGQPMLRLWGSERDIEVKTKTLKSRFFNWLTNTTYLNAFRMSPERMRDFLKTFNVLRPRLIVAYAQAIYELANFAENEGITVQPQRAIVTSAGTLYPFMREKIARIFGCEVYNLYGSREVSDVACEIPGAPGLWVAPWGNYVEVVDDKGAPVPPGTDGHLLITCLTNYAMPLIRYQIGDRGALLPPQAGEPHLPGQVLKHVSGRNVDAFRTRDGTLVDGEYFTHLLYFRSWVWKFQVIQKQPEHVLFKIMLSGPQPSPEDLAEITRKTQLVLGADCTVDFEFVTDLPPHSSGKFRYTISEVTPAVELTR
jgi:phenylacetate-CoA ligase